MSMQCTNKFRRISIASLICLITVAFWTKIEGTEFWVEGIKLEVVYTEVDPSIIKIINQDQSLMFDVDLFTIGDVNSYFDAVKYILVTSVDSQGRYGRTPIPVDSSSILPFNILNYDLINTIVQHKVNYIAVSAGIFEQKHKHPIVEFGIEPARAESLLAELLKHKYVKKAMITKTNTNPLKLCL